MMIIQSNKLLIFFSFFIILFMLILNIYTPLVADDYSYSNGINSISDIFISQYNHYFNWGGRSIAHSLAQFWLLIGKEYFNIANTIIYCIFLFLVQFHIYGSFKINPRMFLVLNIIFWFLVPAWGQNVLWLTGSCNYLWTTAIILFFLLHYRKKYDDVDYKMNIPFSILFLFFGIITGWCNENSGAAVLFFLILYFIIKKINKNKFSLFEILGFVGFLIGFILLITAPGNYVRLDVVQQNNNVFINLLWRFYSITLMIWKEFISIIIFILGFITCMSHFDNRLNKNIIINEITFIYTLTFFAGAYSMIISPIFPLRALFIVVVFVVIVFFITLKNINLKISNFIKKYISIFFLIGFIMLSFSFFDTTRNILRVYLRWYDRIEYILAEKEKGNLSIEVNHIIPYDDKHLAYNGPDISEDENDWLNTSKAAYYGIETLKIKFESEESLFNDKRKRIKQLITPPGKIIKKLRE